MDEKLREEFRRIDNLRTCQKEAAEALVFLGLGGSRHAPTWKITISVSSDPEIVKIIHAPAEVAYDVLIQLALALQGEAARQIGTIP